MKIQQKLKPCFKAALKDDGVLELTVYEEIGEDFWTGGGVTAATVKQQLDAAGSYSSIAIRINSPGGDAFEGVAIHSLLRAQGKPVNVFIDGIAASAASIIAMAGDTITMSSGAMMMIHDAWSMCVGNDEDMRKMADTLERVSASIAQVYADRTGVDLDEVKSLMDAETWMSAADCVKQGFATATAATENKRALALAGRFKSLAKLKNVPDTLKNDSGEEEGVGDENESGCDCSCQACEADDCAHCTAKDCDDENCLNCPMQNPDDPDKEDPDNKATETVAAKTETVPAEPETITAKVETIGAQTETPAMVEEPKESNLSQFEARLRLLKIA